ncbi:hypothetical protein C8Q70DRAFT_987791 [Cubamyces menziesii]|uniref:Uncharacterized protein n=1 Tax=Trametes cubensis TaxID=1111947 RepID=A0AAD7TUW1_9APHY|nr:hypothetical protein C8Q70DRAFT_987791 [Cubamyces menziesii]KAJ8482860.1 hypothetical protein ONZ51_g5079 [Trametes cubensis]
MPEVTGLGAILANSLRGSFTIIPTEALVMSTHAIAQCSGSLRSLASTASTLRRIIRDTEPKVGSIDAFASTHYRKEWADNREKYNNILDATNTAAARLAATIKYYLSLHGDMKHPDAVDDMIAEIGALSVKLQGLNFDQFAELSSLKVSFESIARGLTAAFNQREVAARDELNATQEHVAVFEKQLKDINAQIRKDTEEATHNVVSRASSSFGSFFSLKNKHSEATAAAEETASETNRDKDKKAKDKKPAESASARFKSDAVDQVTKLLSDGGSLLSGGGKESPEAQRRDIQEQLEISEARLIKATSAARAGDRSDLDTVLRAEREIQKGLDAVIEHLKTFPSVTHQLSKQTLSYLHALEAFKADSRSKDNQLALSNMERKIALSSGPWKDVAGLLGDMYAKTQK